MLVGNEGGRASLACSDETTADLAVIENYLSSDVETNQNSCNLTLSSWVEEDIILVLGILHISNDRSEARMVARWRMVVTAI